MHVRTVNSCMHGVLFSPSLEACIHVHGGDYINIVTHNYMQLIIMYAIIYYSDVGYK